MLIRHILEKHKAKGAFMISITPDATLRSAAETLNARKIGALPVVGTDGALVGILSERDIVRICALATNNPLEYKVNEAMTRNLELASPEDSVETALARMTDRRIRHLPVVESGHLMGIVSIGDLVKAQIDTILAEADAIKTYITS
jgi:CBS domain-containing protein